MRFIGYSMNGYRFWDPRENKVVCSRDARFDETQTKYLEEKEDSDPYRFKIVYSDEQE